MRMPIVWTISFILVFASGAVEAAALFDTKFFAFDNGVGRGTWSPEQQAKTLADLGYAGIGYTGTEDLDERLAAFEDHGLKVFNLYVHCRVDRDELYTDELVRAIERLNGTGVDLWLTVQGKAEDDTKAVQAVTEIADLAAASDLKVALYPHTGFFVADIDDALRITRQVNRENQGVTFNLCHELQAGNEARFNEQLDRAAPHLFLVSINGADHEGGWDRLIRPLGDGEFDVYSLLKKLHTIGYDQPIGLQCYAVKGDQVANLRQSMAQWNAYRTRLAEEVRGK